MANENYATSVDFRNGVFKPDVDAYTDPFYPRFWPERLETSFKAGEFVFVCDMGDLFAWSNPGDRIEKVLAVIENNPQALFLLQTKNPGRFIFFNYPPNVYLGTTIETNRDYKLTKAPCPWDRYRDMAQLSVLMPWRKLPKFLSIEPIQDFDVDVLTKWVSDIKPAIVEIGADNYRNSLPEPPWWKVEKLLENLRGICPSVVEKDGLERLRE